MPAVLAGMDEVAVHDFGWHWGFLSLFDFGFGDSKFNTGVNLHLLG